MSRGGALTIWLLTTEYPPFFGGGIGTYAALTVAGWLGEGHRVRVFLCDERVVGPALAIDESEDRLAVVRFGPDYGSPPVRALSGPAAASFQYADAVRECIERVGAPDIVETQDFNAIGYFLLMRKRALDEALQAFPIVVTAHNPNFALDHYEDRAGYLLPRYWTGWMERAALAAADQVIFPSEYLRAAVKSPAPATVLRNPMPLPPAGPPPRRRDRVLAVGRLQLFKGTLELVEGMARLWSRGETASLELLGGDNFYVARGEQMGAYLARRYAGHIAAGRLILSGAHPPAAVAKRMRAAGVVAVCSRFDNLPYTALEAMAHGRVLVASNAGGQRELLNHGDNGWLVDGQDPGAIADGLEAALALSDADWDRIGERARDTIRQHLDPASIAREKSALFQRWVQQHREAAPRRLYPFVEPVPAAPRSAAPALRLSVVIPYFNMGAYVEECLASAYASAAKPDEVVLVDDGSTEPLSIARLYQLEQDPRWEGLRVVRGRNRGLAGARNRGAEAARGQYLAFLDPDDAVERGYWAAALRILDAYDNVSLVGAWAQFFGRTEEVWPAWNPELPYLLYHNTLHSSCLVVRRDHFLAHGQNDPRFVYGLEDWESVVRMVGAGLGGVAIPAVLTRYRVRADSMARALNPESLLFLYEVLLDKHPELVARWSGPLAGLLNSNGPQYLAATPLIATAQQPPYSG